MKSKLITQSFFVLSIYFFSTNANASSDLLIVTSDYSTGSTAFLPADSEHAEINVLAIHSDAVGHYQNGNIYIVNRLGQDNILVLNPENPSLPILQFSVGNGANPHDIEIIRPNKAYVTLYERPELLVVNPTNGVEIKRVDLSIFADSDGLPEVSQIISVGNVAYLSCQRLDRTTNWGPADKSYIILVDKYSDKLIDTNQKLSGVQGIRLSVSNPNRMINVGRKLIVSGSAHFGDRNGGIDIIDLDTQMSLGIAIDEAALGGDLNAIAMLDESRGYAVISDENFTNSVLPFNLTSKTVGKALTGLSGGYIADIVIEDGRLIVADQGSFSDPKSVGLKIFDAENGDLLVSKIDTGLPPVSIIILDSPTVPTAVNALIPLPKENSLGTVYPNPFNSNVSIPFTLAENSLLRITVYDALGRQVKTLANNEFPLGFHRMNWNGQDQKGIPVGNGLYFIRMSTTTQSFQTKVLLLK
ncbi:MAG: T9SS type A sorting domain-containing protein [Candidatus Latescibacterota bacterium]|nr:T9SS type A sorting domain-containing protein [Candidatus Latescibacterota bacterium]